MLVIVVRDCKVRSFAQLTAADVRVIIRVYYISRRQILKALIRQQLRLVVEVEELGFLDCQRCHLVGYRFVVAVGIRKLCRDFVNACIPAAVVFFRRVGFKHIVHVKIRVLRRVFRRITYAYSLRQLVAFRQLD